MNCAYVFVILAMVSLSHQANKEMTLTRSQFNIRMRAELSTANQNRVLSATSSSSNKPACPIDFINRFWLAGFAADAKDDARSTLNCPTGMYVTGCECNDPTLCDGVEPTDNADGCTAITRYGRTVGVKPIIRCRERFNIKDIKIVSTRTVASSLRCEPGYHMDDCYMNDPWSQSRQAYIKKDVFNFGEKTCSYHYRPNQNTANYVSLKAVCVKFGSN